MDTTEPKTKEAPADQAPETPEASNLAEASANTEAAAISDEKAPQPQTLKEVETHFDALSDITDLVAQINSIYESDIEGNLQVMEDFIHDAMSWDLGLLEPDAKRFYLSHMTFHREIVSEIIAEARLVLIEERRAYVKRLVNYHKEFKRWLLDLEKNFAA